jgi:succinate dehydrogenase / fumarate reductase cytochrome b subunit
MRNPISQHPVHLKLTRIRFYPNALLSISHRISGAVLALCLIVGLILANAVLLAGLNTSYITQTIIGKLFILLTLSSLLFHWLSGVRHLIIDWWPAANHQVPQAWFSGWAVSLVFILWAVGTGLLALALFFGGRGS